MVLPWAVRNCDGHFHYFLTIYKTAEVISQENNHWLIDKENNSTSKSWSG